MNESLQMEASCAYVLIVTAVYWVSEAVPLGAAALIPAFLYPLFGVMKSSEVAAEYFKNTTLLLMGVICVAASVEKWNLHKRIALRMVMMAGAKPGIATTTDFSSLMHSKTMNSVHMIANPIGMTKSKSNGQHLAQCISSQAQILVLPPKPPELDLSTKYRYQSRHDHMICKCLSLSISYAATIGGLTTIIGTSTSLIFLEHFNNQYPNAEVVNFGTWFLFSFPISLIMLVLTWFWMHWLFLGCNYPEMVTGFFFILMTLLWFTREPGFVPGWSSFFENESFFSKENCDQKNVA
ncbi:UNVERIFIED_CONTAM: hypothetical protein H355_009679 [Colinus virginianus]|nr:hypothetical protein H355_009679 [Colinus virginianus]